MLQRLYRPRALKFNYYSTPKLKKMISFISFITFNSQAKLSKSIYIHIYPQSIKWHNIYDLHQPAMLFSPSFTKGVDTCVGIPPALQCKATLCTLCHTGDERRVMFIWGEIVDPHVSTQSCTSGRWIPIRAYNWYTTQSTLLAYQSELGAIECTFCAFGVIFVSTLTCHNKA